MPLFHTEYSTFSHGIGFFHSYLTALFFFTNSIRVDTSPPFVLTNTIILSAVKRASNLLWDSILILQPCRLWRLKQCGQIYPLPTVPLWERRWYRAVGLLLNVHSLYFYLFYYHLSHLVLFILINIALLHYYYLFYVILISFNVIYCI